MFLCKLCYPPPAKGGRPSWVRRRGGTIAPFIFCFFFFFELLHEPRRLYQAFFFCSFWKIFYCLLVFILKILYWTCLIQAMYLPLFGSFTHFLIGKTRATCSDKWKQHCFSNVKNKLNFRAKDMFLTSLGIKHMNLAYVYPKIKTSF